MNHLISSLRGVDFPYWKVKLDPYTPKINTRLIKDSNVESKEVP